MAVTKASYETMMAEHRLLRQRVEELRQFLREPRPEVTNEGAHVWAQGLAERLLDLHGKLFLHFQSEEAPGPEKRSGLFESLKTSFPQATQAVERLEEEHVQMLGDLRSVLAAAVRYAGAEVPSDPSLRRRTVAILDQLNRHERDETELVEKLYWQDLGPGD